tara:strand:- start:353 stop:664 length:312 start_codon:yes stop_codon:yes gene_type:complete
MKLDFDIIRYISEFLKLRDILNFSIISKDNYNAFDNLYYKNLAYKFYGRCFWLKAGCRPVSISKPLKNFKLELMRIENFQKNLDNINVSRWTKKDFYNYWKYD